MGRPGLGRAHYLFRGRSCYIPWVEYMGYFDELIDITSLPHDETFIDNDIGPRLIPRFDG